MSRPRIATAALAGALGLAASLAWGGAMAQSRTASQPEAAPYGVRPTWSMPQPDAGGEEIGTAAAGRQVAVGNVRLGAWACVSCHGMEGAGEGAGAIPVLAGLQPWYLYNQLRDYAAGARQHAVMSPIAARLSDREMRDVAAWYAAQPAPRWAPPEVDTSLLQQGGAIAAVGAPDQGVTACAQCHGLRGEGSGPAIPALAGQSAPYLALQLRRWKQGERRNGPLGVMAQVSKAMTDQQITAVAAYFATLPPPTGTATQ